MNWTKPETMQVVTGTCSSYSVETFDEDTLTGTESSGFGEESVSSGTFCIGKTRNKSKRNSLD